MDRAVPSIDIVIPVHNTSRPIERAVSSVVAAQHSRTRAIVVCHNIEASRIAERLGGLAQHDRVTLIELADGIYSPAGPLNAGLAHAEAEYVGFLGSDDEIMPAALEAWAEELAERPTLLIGQIIVERSGRVMTPTPRPGRYKALDPVADLLNMRSAPVGVLIERAFLSDASCPGFREGYRTGEDIALGIYLWNYADRIAYSRRSDGYYGHEDEPDRVTGGTISLEDVVRPVREALELPVLRALPRRRRQAIGAKLMRHQLQYWRTGLAQGVLDANALRLVSELVGQLMSFAPGVRGFFSRADVRAIDAVQRQDSAALEAALARADVTHYSRKLIPCNPLRALAPEAFYLSARRIRQLRLQFPTTPEKPASRTRSASAREGSGTPGSTGE